MRATRKPSVEAKLRRLMSARNPAPLYAATPTCRVTSNSNQSIPNATLTPITFETERWDTDTMHFNSAANLTGTVTKISGGTALGGSGTLFTTELSVGQAISVPGGAAEVAVVAAIIDDTHATVAVGGALGTWANSAVGQTATRLNSAVVCNTPGVYRVFANCIFASNATGRRQLDLRINGDNTKLVCSDLKNAVTDTGAATRNAVCTDWKFQQWDYVEAVVLQASGGALNVSAGTTGSPALGMTRTAAA